MNENNFNKPYDTSTTGTFTNFTNYCLHRLPCGYCTILEKRCPMYYTNDFRIGDTPPYNLNQVTCKIGEN